jgi:hypothetical protein
MARYDSSDANIPGQYPAPSFTGFGLPVQDETSGAGGSPPAGGSVVDMGDTLEPGQYPPREDFTGVPLGGSGAPGSPGVGYHPNGDGQYAGGGDAVTYSKDTTWKSEHDHMGMDPGYVQMQTAAQVAGAPGNMDWTQANPQSYAGRDDLFIPGLAGNMPLPGSGRYQTDQAPAGGGDITTSGPADSSGRVMYGGYLNGQRPATNQHPGTSGPRT